MTAWIELGMIDYFPKAGLMIPFRSRGEHLQTSFTAVATWGHRNHRARQTMKMGVCVCECIIRTSCYHYKRVSICLSVHLSVVMLCPSVKMLCPSVCVCCNAVHPSVCCNVVRPSVCCNAVCLPVVMPWVDLFTCLCDAFFGDYFARFVSVISVMLFPCLSSGVCGSVLGDEGWCIPPGVWHRQLR